MKERPILFSVITGQPSQRGKRLRSEDGLTFLQRNRDAVNAQKRELYANNPTPHAVRSAQYRKQNPDIVREANRQWRAHFWPSLKAEMILAYGGCCACCKECEPMFLQLDHIHNDGCEARRTFRTVQRETLFLKRSGWPKDRHQLLCANCNFGKMLNGGLCPHQK